MIRFLASNMAVLWFIILSAIIAKTGGVALQTRTHDMELRAHQKGSIEIVVSSPVNQTIQVSAELTKSNVVEDIVPVNLTLEANSSGRITLAIRAKDPGHVTVILHSNAPNVDTSKAFVRVSVNKTRYLSILSFIVGWLYFLAWSISFYPQIYTNWRRQSVVGLNFDYVGLNITGFVCYMVYNCGLYFVPKIQEEYFELHPFGVIPVQLNDVVFAVHGSAVTMFTIVQCLIYERGVQRISNVTIFILVFIWGGAVVSVLRTSLQYSMHPGSLLSCAYYFSYAKLIATLVKYIPQAYLNYKRKSTDGWSIGNVLLDFIGGLLSIVQMLIIAYDFNDWTSIFGNFTKFGLGVVSVVFDVLFMAQHYVLYAITPMERMLPDAPYRLVGFVKRQ